MVIKIKGKISRDGSVIDAVKRGIRRFFAGKGRVFVLYGAMLTRRRNYLAVDYDIKCILLSVYCNRFNTSNQ